MELAIGEWAEAQGLRIKVSIRGDYPSKILVIADVEVMERILRDVRALLLEGLQKAAT
jgi:hypothetical protein